MSIEGSISQLALYIGVGPSLQERRHCTQVVPLGRLGAGLGVILFTGIFVQLHTAMLDNYYVK